MSDTLLNILKYLLIALIWLFFLRVARAAWVEIRSPVQAPEPDGTERPAEERQPSRPARRAARAELRLRVVDPAERRGQVFELERDATMGRAPDCDVALVGDTFASKVHAHLFRQDDDLWIEDLGSTNGTFLNSHRLDGPSTLRRGDRLRVGQTVLEVSR